MNKAINFKKLFSPLSLILALLFFTLLYFENIPIATIKFSQIWKLPVYALIFALTVLNLAKKRKGKFPLFFFLGILLAIKIILNTNFPNGILEDISEAISVITLPLFLAFFSQHYNKNTDLLKLIILWFSIFFIISNVPFLLGIIESRGSTRELDKFGLENTKALNGLFYHIATTSKIVLVSLLSLICFKKYFKTLIQKAFYYVVVAIGLFSLYMCYTRTGWLLFLIGFGLLFLIGSDFKRLLFKILPAFIVVAFLGFYWISSNESVMMRLKGETTYRSNSDLDLNQLSSSRLLLFYYSIENLKESGTPGIILGYGRAKARDLMEERLGFGFVAHNRILEVGQYGGITALFLLFLMYYYLYRYSFPKSKPTKKYSLVEKLPVALFWVALISFIPSHGFPIWADLIFAGTIVIGRNEVINRPTSLEVLTD